MDQVQSLRQCLNADFQQQLCLAPAMMAIISVLFVLMIWYGGVGKMVKKNDDYRLPPGPRPWPIIGNMGLVEALAHQGFAKLAKQYGPIVRLRLGSINAIVVSSPQIAEEILKTHDQAFASRPSRTQGKIMAYGRQGVGSAPYGPYWRYARKVFTLELLTNKRVQQFQNIRKDVVLCTLHSILEDCKGGAAVRMDLKFGQLSKNNITRMIINESFFGVNSGASNLQESTGYGETIKEMLRLYGVFHLGDYIPLLQNFDLQGYKKQMRNIQRKNDAFFEQIIEDHRKKLFSSDHQQQQTGAQSIRDRASIAKTTEVMDLVDVLLTRTSDVDERPLTDNQIKAILLDIVVAGTDTSSSLLEWTMTELLRHPAALKRVQEELDAVVGCDRVVEESDIPHLDYFRAVVKESLRVHPVVPLMIPHECTESRKVGGFHIPEKSIVFINTWAMGRDPTVWERALEFYPERFLLSKMDVTGQDFQFLPFGSGRRSCPGRNVAIALVEYTLAVLLHACDWALPPGLSPEDVDLGEAPGASVSKKIPLEAVATPRLPLAVIHQTHVDQME